MAYTKQTWSDGQAGATPITAARLNYIESGIQVAAATADAAVVKGDTGWVNIPGINGYSIGSDGARYRVLNGVCYFQIHIGASTAVAGAILITLPTTARPTAVHWFVGQYAQLFKGELKIDAGGIVSFGTANTPFVAAGSFPVG
jgi:hypothetical protein